MKMAIYTKEFEQKWLKINNKGGWNKDVLGGKKIGKLAIGDEDYSVLKSTSTVLAKNIETYTTI